MVKIGYKLQGKDDYTTNLEEQAHQAGLKSGAKEAKESKKKKSKKLSGWKPTYKSVIKASPKATVVYRGSIPGYHFKQEWEQEKNLLDWK